MPFEVDIYVNVMCLCDKQYCISPNSVVVVVFVFVFVLHCLGSLAGMILFFKVEHNFISKKDAHFAPGHYFLTPFKCPFPNGLTKKLHMRPSASRVTKTIASRFSYLQELKGSASSVLSLACSCITF